MALIPVTILSGFLGSGKTTLLKHILHENHGNKIAVIENEFGEENIDNDILVQDSNEQIVQMSNGCVCCTIRGDLVDALNDLFEQRKDKKFNLIELLLKQRALQILALLRKHFSWMMKWLVITYLMPLLLW